MKSIWLSTLAVPDQEVRALLQKLKAYGLDCSGHQWSDDNAGMAWLGPREALWAAECALWAIMGSKAALSKPETRYGLSLLTLCVESRRGPGFPLVILQNDDEPLAGGDLPTPLQRALVLPAADATTPAKIVARAYGQAAVPPPTYYLDMVGDPHLGQWFELRPTGDEWSGILFGVDEGEIRFQAVGPAGSLPARSTLNHPMQGLRIECRGRPYTAWAVRNPITPESAYYVKVEGTPASILFGAFPEESEAEMVVLDLR